MLLEPGYTSVERPYFDGFIYIRYAAFRLLTSVCEAWRWSRMRNLRRVGKNSCPISRNFGMTRRGPLVLSNTLFYVTFRSEDIYH